MDGSYLPDGTVRKSSTVTERSGRMSINTLANVVNGCCYALLGVFVGELICKALGWK